MLHDFFTSLQWCQMSVKVSQNTNNCSSAYAIWHQIKPQNSALLFFVRRIHRWPVDSPRKGPVMWKTSLCHDVLLYGFHHIQIRRQPICQKSVISKLHMSAFTKFSNNRIPLLLDLITFYQHWPQHVVEDREHLKQPETPTLLCYHCLELSHMRPVDSANLIISSGDACTRPRSGLDCIVCHCYEKRISMMITKPTWATDLPIILEHF